MKNISNSLYITILLALLVTLISCGGGGGDTSSNNTSPPSVEPFVPPFIATSQVQITAGNQNAVAKAAIGSVADVVSSGSESVFGFASMTGPELQNTSTSPFALAKNLLRVIAVAEIGGDSAASNQLQRDVIQGTESCSGGGTYYLDSIITFPLANYLVAGDSISVIFTNCKDPDITGNATFNGEYSINVISGILSLTCDYFCFDAEMDVDLNNLNVTTAGITETYDGVIHMVAEAASGREIYTGNSIYYVVSTGLAERITSFTFDSHTSLGTTTTVATLTLDNSSIGGRVSVTTTSAVTENSSQNNPDGGTLEITGNTSELTMIINDVTYVDFELDTDGVGGADVYTNDELWADILAS